MSVLRRRALPPRVDEPCRAWLLRRCRLAVHSLLLGRTLPPPAEVPPVADQLRGCFVSIHRISGRQHGSMGSVATDLPLWQQAEAMARAAAYQDRRVAPLQLAELEQVAFEITVLGPRAPVAPADIVIGEHGLWVELGEARGVLLPQVAQTHAWDVPTYLRQACLSAGLQADAWRRPQTELSAFRAEIFAETSRLI